MRLFFLFFSLLLLSFATQATHIVGGEMFYEYQGNNKYKITVKLYRDCGPGVSGQYPLNINLAIYKNNGNTFFNQVQIPLPNPVILPNDANNPCLIVPPDICVQEAIYTIDSVYMPPVDGGYTLVCAFCCRNLGILNMITSGNNVGATYFSTVPDSSLGINNEARFNNFPPTVICANYPFTFDHSATDLDGDSLVYALCELYDNSNGAVQPATPQIPVPADIIGPTQYNAPYTWQNPMGGGLTIDPATGLLTVTPSTIGQFVVGISVKEYRNGVLLCEHRRDFQFNVEDCTPTVEAIIVENLIDPNPVIVTNCSDFTVNFPNSSTPNSVYYWDFGIDATGAIDDTSNAFNPTFTFPDTGMYQITLIVHPAGAECTDTAYARVAFYPTLVPGFITDDGCTDNVHYFYDTSVTTFGAINSWYWELDGNASSNMQNPTFVYTDTGVYTVMLVVETNQGCKDTVYTDIEIKTGSIASVFGDTLICKNEWTPIGLEGIGTAVWSPNYNISDTSYYTPEVHPEVSTMYYVTVVSPDGCIETDSVYVQVWDTLVAVAGPDTVLCPGESVTLTGSGGIVHRWFPSTGLSTTNAAVTVAAPQNTVTYGYVAQVSGCRDTALVTVEVRPFPTVYLPDSAFICPYDSVQFHPVGGTTYAWSPALHLSDTTIANPWASPEQTTTYYLTAQDLNACPATLYDTIVVTVPNNTHEISEDITVILGDSTILAATGGASYAWSPSAGLNNPFSQTPVAAPVQTTTYTVTITFADGCQTKDSVIVYIELDPVMTFPNAFVPNGDGLNDRFRPFVVGLVDIETFRIYNRWGNLVYESKDLKGWDGSYKGEPQPIGSYAYYLIGKGQVGNKQLHYTGNFVLLR